MENLKEYQKIISDLNQLKSITPSEQLRTHFETTLISALPDKKPLKLPLFGYSFRFAAFILMLLFLSSSGIVLAAEHSTPDSLLYPVKQAVQEAKLAVLSDPTTRALLHLEKAEDKIEEIKQFLSDNNDEKLERGVKDYQDNLGKVIQETQKLKEQNNNAIQIIEQSLGNQTRTLQLLQNTAPAPAQPAIEKAIDASQKGQEQAQEVLQNNPSNYPGPEQNNSGNQETGKPSSLPEPPQNVQNQSTNSQQGQDKANELKKN